jgi:hypothetical protein
VAELITDQRGAVAVVAVEVNGNLHAPRGKRPVIVIIAEGSDRTQAPATVVKSLAESVAGAHISTNRVVAGVEAGKKFCVRRIVDIKRRLGTRRSYRTHHADDSDRAATNVAAPNAVSVYTTPHGPYPAAASKPCCYTRQ